MQKVLPLMFSAAESSSQLNTVCLLYRVSFLTGAPLKVLSVRLHSKSHQKSVRIYLPKKTSPCMKTTGSSFLSTQIVLQTNGEKGIMSGVYSAAHVLRCHLDRY